MAPAGSGSFHTSALLGSLDRAGGFLRTWRGGSGQPGFALGLGLVWGWFESSWPGIGCFSSPLRGHPNKAHPLQDSAQIHWNVSRSCVLGRLRCANCQQLTLRNSGWASFQCSIVSHVTRALPLVCIYCCFSLFFSRLCLFNFTFKGGPFLEWLLLPGFVDSCSASDGFPKQPIVLHEHFYFV